MSSFARAVWVAGARTASHAADGGELMTAILAGVFGLCASFIEFVSAFASAIWVTRARACGKRTYTAEFVSAVFTIEFFHNIKF